MVKIKGIDVSNNNGKIDWEKVKTQIDVAYIKATEGTSYVDGYLDINYCKAKQAGVKVGFYHFLVGTSAPESQAINFYNQIKDKQNDLKPCLDIESNGFDVMDYALKFISKFQELSKMDICIYTYSGFMSNIDERLSEYVLWEANYNNTPWKLPNNIFYKRVGHQYTEKGSINGVQTKVDLNEFTQDIFLNSSKKYYIVTDYIKPGYRESGDESYGVDMEYVQSYFPDIRIYVKSNEKGIWFETQYLSKEKCQELKESLGRWFYEIKEV